MLVELHSGVSISRFDFLLDSVFIRLSPVCQEREYEHEAEEPDEFTSPACGMIHIGLVMRLAKSFNAHSKSARESRLSTSHTIYSKISMTLEC